MGLMCVLLYLEISYGLWCGTLRWKRQISVCAWAALQAGQLPFHFLTAFPSKNSESLPRADALLYPSANYLFATNFLSPSLSRCPAYTEGR